MDDDLWRADGSFRGMSGGGGGGGKGRGRSGKGGGNPQFTRVIPKFLQKFQQPPEIQAKFAPPTDADGDDADDDELDDVQRAAIDEYLAKQKEKQQRQQQQKEENGSKEDAEDRKKSTESGGVGDAEHKAARRKRVMQSVAELGKTGKDATRGKKRKRSSAPPAKLSNKTLLSFSMEDEE